MEKEILIKGRKIVYFEEGEGPPFLIIHGWGGPEAVPDFLNFQKMMAEKGFKVYLLELPGFGKGDMPGLKWKTDDYIGCVLSFQSELGIKKFHLLGHSFGGVLAIKIASIYPDVVQTLILCSPALTGSKITFLRLIQGVGFFSFLTAIRLSYALFRPLIFILKKIYKNGKIGKNAHNGGWLGKLRRILYLLAKLKKFYFDDKMAKLVMKLGGEEETKIFLKQIKSPTLVIWGGKDFYNPLQVAADIGYLTECVFKILPEAGHSLQRENSEKLADLIGNFIISTSIFKSDKDKEP